MLHGMAGAVPSIEIADYRDLPGIGRPDSEANAFRALFAYHVRAQHPVTLVMSTLAVQVQLERGQGRSDGGCLHTVIMALDAAAS